MLTQEHLDTLRKPFQPRQHEFLNGLAYITESAITERLESVDPSWDFQLLSTWQRDQQIIVTGRLTVNGVSRDGVGMKAIERSKDGLKEYGEAEKAAATDALKRAARLFGVGRYLLDLGDAVKDQATLADWLRANYAKPPNNSSGKSWTRDAVWPSVETIFDAYKHFDNWLSKRLKDGELTISQGASNEVAIRAITELREREMSPDSIAF